MQSERLRLRRRADDAELVHSLIEMAEHSEDSAYASSAALECAHAHEFAGAAETSLQQHLTAAHLAHSRQNGELTIAWSLQRAYWHAGQLADLARTLETEAEKWVDDPEVRLQLLSEAATSYLRAGKTDPAEQAARRALELNASFIPALRLMSLLALRPSALGSLRRPPSNRSRALA